MGSCQCHDGDGRGEGHGMGRQFGEAARAAATSSSRLPAELVEAARIDGASEWAIFHRIAVPILMPGIAVISMLGFAGAWNDFFWPLVVLTDTKLWLVNIAISALVGPYDYQYGILLAAATLGSIPVIIVFLIFQKHLIAGITSGAIKGA